MATQPGFLSINLHRSRDGGHVVNYIQWNDADTLAAAHHSPNSARSGRGSGKSRRRLSPAFTTSSKARRPEANRK